MDKFIGSITKSIGSTDALLAKLVGLSGGEYGKK